jgi:hypothetical protein
LVGELDSSRALSLYPLGEGSDVNSPKVDNPESRLPYIFIERERCILRRGSTELPKSPDGHAACRRLSVVYTWWNTQNILQIKPSRIYGEKHTAPVGSAIVM